MPGLSTPIGELRARYGVVVVGSGYGGAIAAYRMACAAQEVGTPGRPKYSVCLLERGLEIRPGDYPATFASAVGQVQADTRFGRIGRRTGLFDFRVNPDVSVLVGCGLGGGSLINAGVMLSPIEKVFKDKKWPQGLTLDTEFKTVGDALGARPVPDDVSLLKITRLFEAGERAKPPAGTWSRPPVAVSFQTGVNTFGVLQHRCVLCGDCMTGCNHSAKNTLIMNYLPGAAKAGASIFCGVEVRAIEPAEGEWFVHARILDAGSRRFGMPELTIRAGAVFLASGTLGSTETLLRSRRRYGLSLSDQLGHRFSGNGDAIAFGYNARDPVNGIGHGRHVPRAASVGPLIAGMLDEREKESGAMIQEGSIPGALAPVLRVAAPFMARFTHIPLDTRFDFSFKHLWRELDSLIRGARHGALLRTQTFLAMSRDDPTGTMRLVRNRLRIAWPHAGEQAAFRKIARRLAKLTRVMGGRYVVNPIWSRLFGRRLITVHPLGGCCIGDTVQTGVVDDAGRVFKQTEGRQTSPETHEGLYVCDGSIIPLPLGTNPALTISALAERIATQAVPVVAKQVRPAPSSASAMRVESPGRIEPSVPGIRYAERLRGSIRLDGEDARFQLFLHISAEDVKALIKEPAHEARVVGVARVEGRGREHQRLTVSEGVLNVMVDDPRAVDTKLLIYRLRLTCRCGKEEFWLFGHKTINLATCRRSVWRAISHLPFVIYARDKVPDSGRLFEAGGRACERIDSWTGHRDPALFLEKVRAEGIVGAGRVDSTVLDAVRLVAGLAIAYERSFSRRLWLRWRYAWYFADAVFQARVWPLRRPQRVNPFDRPPRAELKIVESQPISDSGKNGLPRFLLTRCREKAEEIPPKGPIMLAPGFGMSIDAFRVGSPSITEYLCRCGYEVWLFDYRATDRLAISLEQFTLDELALEDFPDAVKRVQKETGKKVRLLFHCVASLTALMALLRRTLDEQSVHSVVLSQSFAFIDHPWINRLKARLRLPQFLRFLNFRPTLTSDYDLKSSWRVRLLDRVLHFYPSPERCTSGVCRRLLLMYGEVVRHDQLDLKTHDVLYDLFDRANLSTFEHLGRMIARGRIVDKHGKDTYLTKKGGENVRVPITLLQGHANRLFRPRGAHRTLAWLHDHGGFGSREKNEEHFKLALIPKHGHLDTFIGKHAADEVYPRIRQALEDMNTLVKDAT